MAIKKTLVWCLLKDGFVVEVLMAGNKLRCQIQEKVAKQQNCSWKDLEILGYKVQVAELNFDFLPVESI